MHVDGYEGFELCPLHLVQVLCGLPDQGVEDVQELVVGLLHYLAVGAGLEEGRLGVAGPDHLDAQDADLEGGKYF